MNPQADLINAMMLLEMIPDVIQSERENYSWAAQSLVQHAWQQLAGHVVAPIRDDTLQLLAAIAAKTAIFDASQK